MAASFSSAAFRPNNKSLAPWVLRSLFWKRLSRNGCKRCIHSTTSKLQDSQDENSVLNDADTNTTDGAILTVGNIMSDVKGVNGDSPETYLYGSDGRRLNEAEGLFYLNKISLPKDLKDSLTKFYQKYPAKLLTDDGQHLARYLRNRGRPTERSWRKYNESKKTKSEDSLKIESTDSSPRIESTDDFLKVESTDNIPRVETGDKSPKIESANQETDAEESFDAENEDQLLSENDTDVVLRRDAKREPKRPKDAAYTMLKYGKRESAAFVASRFPACFGAAKRVFSEINKSERDIYYEAVLRGRYTIFAEGWKDFLAGEDENVTNRSVALCYGCLNLFFQSPGDFANIKKRDSDFEPRTLLDFGSGTGTAIWAAKEVWGRSLKEYQCVDISDDANKTCEYILRGGDETNRPLKIPGVYFRKFLPLSNKVTYDVVVASYSLSEMPFAKQRQAIISSLWGKTNDFLVIIEPGNNEGFDIVLQARDYVTKAREDIAEVVSEKLEAGEEIEQENSEDGFYYTAFQDIVDPGFVYAPCPHDDTCPLSKVSSRDHPCNFEQKVELSFSQRNTTLKRWGYMRERFSYLVLRKGQRDSQETVLSRVLQPPKHGRRKVMCDLCKSNGTIEKHIITKRKDSNIYKGVRHCLKWGDLMPELDNKKKPLQIIRLADK